jgi:multiple sugar transport system permease protein
MSTFKRSFTFKNNKYSEWLTGYLFVAPILILMAIWFYYPISRSLVYSFTDANMVRLGKEHFIGFTNYINVLKDEAFLNSLKISFILTIVSVPVQTALALIIAVNLNRLLKYKAFFRTLYYLPYITAPIAVATIFMYLFVKGGILTNLFSYLGVENDTWHSNMKLVLPFLIILCIWTYIGFYVVAYLSGLQSIPLELYESSEVDGANAIQKFWNITVPMLKHTTSLVVISGVIFVLQFFDQPYALSRGGSLGYPAGASSTIVIFFYNEAFKNYKIGYGSAAAFILFALLLILTVGQNFLFEREEGAKK